jgi:hypothetical protein
MWISIYRELPEDGQKCKSRIRDEDGFCGSSVYCAKTGTFRTYEDCRNRLIITVWKHNEWAALEPESSTVTGKLHR